MHSEFLLRFRSEAVLRTKCLCPDDIAFLTETEVNLAARSVAIGRDPCKCLCNSGQIPYGDVPFVCSLITRVSHCRNGPQTGRNRSSFPASPAALDTGRKGEHTGRKQSRTSLPRNGGRDPLRTTLTADFAPLDSAGYPTGWYITGTKKSSQPSTKRIASVRA